MRIPDGVLEPEIANDPVIVTRKAGLTPWHCRLLVALEKIASYYDTIPAVTARKGRSDA